MKRKPPKRGRSNYEVGYGRPPKQTQFKKGTSGNKKGRPKGIKNIATLFREAMYQKVTIMENGERRTVTKAEAAIKQLINKAATGDSKAFQTWINIASQLGDLMLPDPLRQPEMRRFTLNVFEKNLETGEHIRVKPGTRESIADDHDK